MNAIEELEDVVKDGLVADILCMEQARALHAMVGVHADTLNKPALGGFGELFGTFQVALERDAVLAVARVFDKSKSKYPTRCLRRALSILETRSSELPEISDPYNTKITLSELNFESLVADSVDLGRNEFLNVFVPSYRAILDDPLLTETIERLKYVRDKRVAHNEAAPPGGPTWESLDLLITVAKKFVGVIGCAFFGTVYVHEGEYVLTDDAERPSRAMKRLVEMLESCSVA